ncbi:MAG: RNA polymerase sigma factor [Myxococcaceae bacterium]
MSDQRVLELYQQWGPVVYRRCLRLLRDPEWAKDATQDVFLQAARQLEKLEAAERVLPWLYRISTHRCLNLRRGARRREAHELVLEVREEAREHGYDETQLGQQVLARFDATTQAVAVGVLVDGMKHEELAQVLQISSKTVSRKLQRFLVQARKYLARST